MCGAKEMATAEIRHETVTQTKITKTPFHMQIIAPDLQSAVQIGLRRKKSLPGHQDTVPANDIVCIMKIRTAAQAVSSQSNQLYLFFQVGTYLSGGDYRAQKKLLGREGI